jgi:hypothetical protein
MWWAQLLNTITAIHSGGTAPITPPPVAGYSLWLDGKDSTAFTFSSSNVVSSWLDKSGNAYNFSQATVAKQPTRGATGLLSFDGSNDVLVAATKFMDNMHNGGSNTFFMVFNATSNGGTFLDDGAAGSATVGFDLYNSSATNFGIYVSRGVSGSSAVSASSNTRQANGTLGLATIRLDANDATAANRAYYYSNTGAAQQTNALTNAPSTAASTYLPSMAADGSGGDFLTGYIGEIVWYASDLSTPDREAVRDYLISKWSI